MGIQFDPSQLATVSPIPTDYEIGDEVIFTNEFGVVFDEGFRVIGFSKKEDVFNGRFIHLDTDAPWFPARPEMLTKKH
ncbi:hypothetical protein [Alteromonas gilva]|uniref:Uncharacterized protein n=1 Tax=Alteromonas gilva TaxID=2987522 RepID=A0ABT5L780_9ALTE|nr:hypothetical protein [Alteromonas gilva]MDC8832925.1 hypothetical protein [Alteromonas gilva]